MVSVGVYMTEAISLMYRSRNVIGGRLTPPLGASVGLATVVTPKPVIMRQIPAPIVTMPIATSRPPRLSGTMLGP